MTYWRKRGTCTSLYARVPRDRVPIPIEVILGSGGLAVFAVWAVNALWKSHLEQDKRERDRADALETRLNRIADKLERSPKAEPPR